MIKSEATGLLAPGGPGAEPSSPRERASRITVLAAVEASLLGFALAVPLSLAAAQIFLGVFMLAWILSWRSTPAFRPRLRPRLAPVALGLLFTGEILAALVNHSPSHLDDPFRKHGVLIALPALAAVAAARPIFYRRVIGLAAATGAIVAFYAIWQHFMGVDVIRDRALEPHSEGAFIATGAFSHHLTYGGSAMLLLIAAAGLVAGGERWRGLPAALVLPLGFGLLWSYARSAWGGAFVGVAALVSVRRGRRTLMLAAAACAAGVLALALDSTVRARVEESFRWQGTPPRLRLWQAAVRMLADHPLGIGPGRFDELFMRYWTPGRIHSTVHAHSDPLRAALDGGPLGVAGYFGLVGGALVCAARGLRRRRGADGAVGAGVDLAASSQRDLLLIAMAASAAFIVSGLFQTYFWDQEDVMLWLLLAAPAFSLRDD